MENKKVFITGAAGFIAGHLFRHLEKSGYQVRGIDNFMHPSNNPICSRIEYGDVRYMHDIEKHVEWCDVVVHCAAQIHVDKSIENPQETIDINVTGTLNVLEAARKYGKKVVFASTSEIYGTSQTKKMGENHQLDCQSPYGASKVAGDRLCKSYRDTYGMDVAILRNFNTFGPYQNDGSYGSVISIFTRRILDGQRPLIYGDGNQERDYMYITDAVAGYMLCIENEVPVINIGSGKTVKINQIAKMIAEIAGKEDLTPEHIEPRAGEVQRLCADIKAAKALGFTPETSFKDHLERFVRWYAKENGYEL